MFQKGQNMTYKIEKFNDTECIVITKYECPTKEVTIPNEIDGLPVVSIVKGVFRDCEILEKINLPQSLEFIGKLAFDNCVNLKEIVLPPKVKVIESKCFQDCKALSKITLSENLEMIKEKAFSECESLSEIVWNKKLKIIDRNSFECCDALKELHIPSSVRLIADRAFADCKNFELLDFDHNEQELKEILIEKRIISFNHKMLYIPEIALHTLTMQELEEYFINQLINWKFLNTQSQEYFYKKWKTEEYYRELVFLQTTDEVINIYFKEGFNLELDELDVYMDFHISNQNSLSTAILLDYKNKTFSVEEIDDYQNEKDLIEIGLKLPTLYQLERKWEIYDMEDYLSIESYKGNNEVELIPDSIDTGKPIKYFAYQVMLAVSRKNRIYRSVLAQLPNNSLSFPVDLSPIEKIIFPNGDEIYLTEEYFNSKVKEVVIPTSEPRVYSRTFHNLQNLENVILHDNITIIDDDAFSFCTSLAKITLPKNLTYISNSAFAKCQNLKELVFPPKLQIIEMFAFAECDSLTEITFPKSLVKVARFAFSKCKNLKKVLLTNDNIDIDPQAFDQCEVLEFVGYENGENIIDKFNCD